MWAGVVLLTTTIGHSMCSTHILFLFASLLSISGTHFGAILASQYGSHTILPEYIIDRDCVSRKGLGDSDVFISDGLSTAWYLLIPTLYACVIKLGGWPAHRILVMCSVVSKWASHALRFFLLSWQELNVEPLNHNIFMKQTFTALSTHLRRPRTYWCIKNKLDCK